MKNFFKAFFVIILLVVILWAPYLKVPVFASPEDALYKANLAEKLLIKLQSNEFDEEVENIYKYLETIYNENTQFYSYNIEQLESLMDSYRSSIITSARNMALNEDYKGAVEFLESKSELFKDKSTINSLILHYSKFFVKDGLIYYDKTPKILSLNKLISYPSIAFCEDNLKLETFDNDYLTSKEFSNLLSELYLNDYILINLSDCFEIQDNIITKKDLYLPQNKTPIILIFNNINYLDTNQEFIEKFIIDGKDTIACYNKKQAQNNQISYNTDFIPILENFILQHNDFSFNNAKAVITFNKNDGILGYNINKTNPNLSQDSSVLKKLVIKLKSLGYQFGYSLNNFDSTKFEEEKEYLQEYIFPVFGNLNICYLDSQKNFENLSDLGFKIFINLGENSLKIKNNKLIVTAKNFGGKTLRERPLLLIIDYEKIYDHTNRTKLF